MSEGGTSGKERGGWLFVPGAAAPDGAVPGRVDESELERRVASLVESGKLTRGEIHYVRKYELALLERTTLLSDKRLERVRALCGLWEIDLKPVRITSHRRFVGPFIVAVKKLVIPILKVALADLVRQQRAFNREAIALLAELASETNDSTKAREEGS